MTLNEQLQANRITELERQLQAYKDAIDLDKVRNIYRGSGWVNTLEGILELITDQVKRNLE